MALNNLPRITATKPDGNLRPDIGVAGPKTLVIGNAGKGMADVIYRVTSTTAAKSQFGSEGSLIRGMFETKQSGAEDVFLYRIGATSAVVTGIGDALGAGGYRIETVDKDASAGADYAFYYDDTENRLVVKRNSDDLVVYDNGSTPLTDRYEVNVSGSRAVAGGGDIGSASGFVNLEDVVEAGAVYVDGTDGLDLSKMELYEKLYVAYKDLLSYNFDVVVPMSINLDDYNVIPQGNVIGAVVPDNTTNGANTYPTAGSYVLGQDVDSLGRVYVEQYEGTYYFWWDFGASAFSAADIFPAGIGSASATLKIDGTALTDDDFHEVNFAYQLARFLHDYSTDIVDATGVVGTLPPAGNTVRDRARWLGKVPTWTLNTETNEPYIASSGDNGTGLLGNKFMAGRDDWRSGVYGGGFILTDGEFMDSGEEILDTNEIPVDLGKYISVVAENVYMRNAWYSSGYEGSFAPSYAGLYVNLPANIAPTNRKVSNTVSIRYRFGLNDLDLLDGAGYVVLRNKVQGLVVADAPSASMPNSDWNRLSTVRIVKQVIDGIRIAGDPYLGKAMSGGAKAALKEDVQKVLQKAVSQGFLQRYEPFEIQQTPDQEVAGVADINLTLVPAFELRVINVSVSLSKSA